MKSKKKKRKTFSEKQKEARLRQEEKELESLCKKCGLCCHVKIGLSDGSYIVHPTIVCKYLTKNNTCSVYEKRFNVKDKLCFTRKEMIMIDYLLPEGCPYTKLREGYKGARVVTSAEFDNIIVREIEIGNYNVLLANRAF